MWVNLSFICNYVLQTYMLYVIFIGPQSLMSVCSNSYDESLALLDGEVSV